MQSVEQSPITAPKYTVLLTSICMPIAAAPKAIIKLSKPPPPNPKKNNAKAPINFMEKSSLIIFI